MMKQLTQTLSDLPYTLVNYGVDTLVLNVRYADEHGKPIHSELVESQIDSLNEWQDLAREAEEPVPVPVIFQNTNLLMHPHGAGKGQWRWLLTSSLLNLCISRGRLNGVIAQVRLSAQLLWSAEHPVTHHQDLWPLLQDLEAFLMALFRIDAQSRLHLQVSEIHLCADIAGWDLEHGYNWNATMLSRARRRVPRASYSLPEPDECSKHGCPAAADGSFLWQGPENEVPTPIYNGQRLETLEFGSHGSVLSCSIYNKSKELKHSGKVWFQDIWKRHGYDGQGDVWRVEFRWKREALHTFKQEHVFHGIESIADLRSYLPYLWTYSAGHLQGGKDKLPDGWLRYVSPTNDKTPTRWPVHPAWLVVQSAFTTHTETVVNTTTGEVVEQHPISEPLAVLIRERQREVNLKKLAQQMGGCASTMSAWLTGRKAKEPLDLFAVFDWLMENLPAYAFPELVKQAQQEGIMPEDLSTLLHERYEALFTEKALDKQVRYGRRSTQEQ